MYAYCVREKTKLFQCISKSKNDCKLIPSVLGFADFIGKGRDIISEGYGFENRDLGISCDFLEFLVISCNILKYLHHKAKKSTRTKSDALFNLIDYCLFFIACRKILVAIAFTRWHT